MLLAPPGNIEQKGFFQKYPKLIIFNFFRKRQSTEQLLFDAVVDRLGGKCCRQDCKANKCRAGCKPYSTCTTADKGLFIDVRYFQFLDFDIHDDVKGRYLRQVTVREKKEEANFKLQEKVTSYPLLTMQFCSVTFN